MTDAEFKSAVMRRFETMDQRFESVEDKLDIVIEHLGVGGEQRNIATVESAVRRSSRRRRAEGHVDSP